MVGAAGLGPTWFIMTGGALDGLCAAWYTLAEADQANPGRGLGAGTPLILSGANGSGSNANQSLTDGAAATGSGGEKRAGWARREREGIRKYVPRRAGGGPASGKPSIMPSQQILNPIVARNEQMQQILARAGTIAGCSSAVMLVGETGVGKELFAEYIHRSSPRSEKPLVKVGLAALPRELIESELFGHEKGAFTHALNQKKGLFELSSGGSIFLDDIDDFPLELQAKLLRVLESHEVMRIGGTAPIRVDIRLITATKVDLKNMVNRGLFRADLYYRINVMPIEIPPLRERRDDIPLLVDTLLERFAPGRRVTVSEEACRALVAYDWPGNIRELRNVIQRCALFAGETIREQDLPPEIRCSSPLEVLTRSCAQCMAEDEMSFEQVVACLESNLLRQALKQAGGNRAQAARALKMSLSTFRDKLRKYNIQESSGEDAGE